MKKIAGTHGLFDTNGFTAQERQAAHCVDGFASEGEELETCMARVRPIVGAKIDEVLAAGPGAWRELYEYRNEVVSLVRQFDALEPLPATVAVD